MAVICRIAGINRAVLKSPQPVPPMSNIDFSTAFKTEARPLSSTPVVSAVVASDPPQPLDEPPTPPAQGARAKMNSVAIAVLSAAAAGLICAFTLFNSAIGSNTVRRWSQDESRGKAPLDASAARLEIIPSLQNALMPSAPAISWSKATDPASLTSARPHAAVPASFQLSNNSIGAPSAATPGAPDALTASLLNSTTTPVTAAAQRITQPLEHQVSVIVEHKVVRVSAASATKAVRNQATKAQVNTAANQTAKTSAQSITSTTRSTPNIGSSTQSLSASGFSATGGLPSVSSSLSAQSAVQSAGAALGGLGKH